MKKVNEAKRVLDKIRQMTEDRTIYWRTADNNGSPVKPTLTFPQTEKEALSWSPEEKYDPKKTYTLWKQELVGDYRDKDFKKNDWVIARRNVK